MALISTTGPICPNVVDTPLDNRSRVSTIAGIGNIPLAWKGMLVYCEENGKTYKVTSLKPKRSGPVEIENYYPATWVEFGSGGSTPSPTPSDIDAGDVSYFSSGTFSNNTVGKELQSLANDILSLAEDIHNLSGDIGTLSNLNTENKQDLVAAINEVLASTGSTIAVVDNLVSNSTTDALSAYQGKVLKGLVDGKVTGIKVQGESSVLPMDGSGIVTIPAGGGGSTGTITGATIGGSQVPEIGGILQFQAYPTVPITGIKDANGNSLNPNNGIVTLPPIPGNNKPIVIPPSAVELPVSTSNPDYIDYDSDTTYVMNIDRTQVATIHYPYVDNNNNYVAFKAIDRDLYYAYIVSVVNDAERYTYSNQYTWSTLPADAKSKFESGIYAIKQVINDDGTLPEKKWYKNIPSVFVDKNNLPLRSRRINETISSSVIDVVLVKNDRLNKIYRYAFNVSHNTWVLINGGCYTKDDATTGENYIKYDAYFDRQPASNILFDDSLTQLGTQEDPVTDVQAAINQLATGVSGLTGKLKICLKYANASPIVNKEVSITVNYRGSAYDISSQYSPDTEGFKTDSNGYVINANNNEYIVLPLGAVYTIHLYDISDSYLTPEDITGVVDTNTENINFIYQNAIDVEFVYFYVQMPNVSPSVANVENKIINVDFYSNPSTHVLTYKCVLRANGTVKQILNADGTQASYNGENLISDYNAVLLPVPIGTKYLSSLQLWDTTISESQQRYVKSPDVIYTASKNKRTVKFTYYDNQVGIFLVVSDSSTTKGYRECLITNIDNQNNIITFKDGDYTYEAYQDNSVLYRKLTTDVVGEQWEETILGYGIRTSATINQPNDDSYTNSEYPNCSFMLPKTPTTKQGQLYSASGSINIALNYGGLFVSRLYNELSGAGTSPVINDLLNNNDLALTLTTTGGGTKVIKAFGVTLDQFRVIVGIISQIESISTILFSINYTYKTSSVTSVQPITLVTNNGATPTNTGYEVPNFIAETLISDNPRARSIGTTNLHIIIAYPF